MRRLPRARESVRMGAEMKFTNFIEDGIWLKGNLHTHTTNSDGELPPERVVRAYRERGYQFLCLSDHNIFTAYPQFNEKDKFVMIPGFELSIHNDKSPEKVMHVNVMSRNSTYDFEQDEEFDIPDPEDGLAFLRNHAENNIERGMHMLDEKMKSLNIKLSGRVLRKIVPLSLIHISMRTLA